MHIKKEEHLDLNDNMDKDIKERIAFHSWIHDCQHLVVLVGMITGIKCFFLYANTHSRSSLEYFEFANNFS